MDTSFFVSLWSGSCSIRPSDTSSQRKARGKMRHCRSDKKRSPRLLTLWYLWVSVALFLLQGEGTDQPARQNQSSDVDLGWGEVRRLHGGKKLLSCLRWRTWWSMCRRGADRGVTGPRPRGREGECLCLDNKLLRLIYSGAGGLEDDWGGMGGWDSWLLVSVSQCNERAPLT